MLAGPTWVRERFVNGLSPTLQSLQSLWPTCDVLMADRPPQLYIKMHTDKERSLRKRRNVGVSGVSY